MKCKSLISVVLNTVFLGCEVIKRGFHLLRLKLGDINKQPVIILNFLRQVYDSLVVIVILLFVFFLHFEIKNIANFDLHHFLIKHFLLEILIFVNIVHDASDDFLVLRLQSGGRVLDELDDFFDLVLVEIMLSFGCREVEH